MTNTSFKDLLKTAVSKTVGKKYQILKAEKKNVLSCIFNFQVFIKKCVYWKVTPEVIRVFIKTSIILYLVSKLPMLDIIRWKLLLFYLLNFSVRLVDALDEFVIRIFSYFQALLESWRDWTGARHIYINFPDQLNLIKITLYHNQTVEDVNLFTYIVVVKCDGVTTKEKEVRIISIYLGNLNLQYKEAFLKKFVYLFSRRCCWILCKDSEQKWLRILFQCIKKWLRKISTIWYSSRILTEAR